MGCFVYAIFGSVRVSAIGPTAIASILTRENLIGLSPEFAVLLTFLSGCVELLMGFLQLGKLSKTDLTISYIGPEPYPSLVSII